MRPKTQGHRTLRPLGLLFVPVLLLPTASHAQWTPYPPPVESPYWWTLTDEVSPEQLRDELQDPKKHEQRLRAEMERRPVSGRRSIPDGWTKQYVDGSSTPALFPMWTAFDAFSVSVNRPHRYTDREAIELLVRYGISPEGSQAILDASRGFLTAFEVVIDEIGTHQREFADILGSCKAQLNYEDYEAAVSRLDVALFSKLSGIPKKKVEVLMKDWLREPTEETAIPALVELRSVLTPADWSEFRAYLLDDVATRMSVTEIDPGEEGA